MQRCNPPVQNLFVQEIIPHPQYDPAVYKNDIGLLRVSTMNFNVGKSKKKNTNIARIDLKKDILENVQPVCLPIGPERTKTYSSVFVTGWGITNSSTGTTETFSNYDQVTNRIF